MALFGFKHKNQLVAIASSQWENIARAGSHLVQTCGANNQGGASVVFGKPYI